MPRRSRFSVFYGKRSGTQSPAPKTPGAQSLAPSAGAVPATVPNPPTPSMATSLASEAVHSVVAGAAMTVGSRVVDAIVGPRALKVEHVDPCASIAQEFKACETANGDGSHECRALIEKFCECHLLWTK